MHRWLFANCDRRAEPPLGKGAVNGGVEACLADAARRMGDRFDEAYTIAFSLAYTDRMLQISAMKGQMKPLYRSVNTRTHGVRHGSGAKSKWARNTKASAKNVSMKQSMHSGQRHGYDYTPLFKFLLSRVGKNWTDVHSEAIARLDREDPITWIVAASFSDGKPFVRVGESSYFSGLYVDEDNLLAVVDPELTAETMRPFCACCTHTLNGVRLTTPYSASSDQNFDEDRSGRL